MNFMCGNIYIYIYMYCLEDYYIYKLILVCIIILCGFSLCNLMVQLTCISCIISRITTTHRVCQLVSITLIGNEFPISLHQLLKCRWGALIQTQFVHSLGLCFCVQRFLPSVLVGTLALCRDLELAQGYVSPFLFGDCWR